MVKMDHNLTKSLNDLKAVIDDMVVNLDKLDKAYQLEEKALTELAEEMKVLNDIQHKHEESLNNSD